MFLTTLLLLVQPAMSNPDVDVAIDQVLTEFSGDLGIDSTILTVHPRIVLPWAAGTRVRLSQKAYGYPVVGHEIVVSLDLNGNFVRSVGEPIEDLAFNPSPNVMPYAAEALAQAAAHMRSRAQGVAWNPRSELVVWVGPSGKSHLAWQVDVSTGVPFGTWRVFVDAHDATVLFATDTLKTAKGNVYDTNPKVGAVIEVDLPGITGSELSGPNALVVSCDVFANQSCSAKSQHSSPDGDGNFLFQPDPLSTDDPMAEIQMYYHLDLVGQWFTDRYGIDLGPVEGLVNFDFDNAFFGDADGDGIAEVAFGQNNTIDFAYDSDVIYHEYGHRVFGAVVSAGGFFDADEYGILFAAASLNEGMADAFSVAINQDPKLGEYAGSAFPPYADPIRVLDKPLHCPTDLYGESHRDGEIWGSFSWHLMTDDRVGFDLGADVIWGALTSWPSDVTWSDAGNSVPQVADDMLAASVIDQDAHDAIVGLATDMGLVDCGRVVSLDDGATPTQFIIAVGFIPDIVVPLQNQFVLNVPANAEELRFRVTDLNRNDPNMGYTVFMRRGGHVIHTLENMPAFGVVRPVPETYDRSWDGTDGDFEIILSTTDEDNLLEPGSAYYFSIASRTLGTLQYAVGEITVDGRVVLGDPIEEETGGCGCTTANPSGALWLALPLALLGLRRRQGR